MEGVTSRKLWRCLKEMQQQERQVETKHRQEVSSTLPVAVAGVGGHNVDDEECTLGNCVATNALLAHGLAEDHGHHWVQPHTLLSINFKMHFSKQTACMSYGACSGNTRMAKNTKEHVSRVLFCCTQ